MRYRFDVSAQKTDIDDAIADAEARQTQRAQREDPTELNELANLYFSRGQLAGDRRDFAAAETLAKRSLEILPSPNGATLTLAKLANARHDFRGAIAIAERYHGRNATAVPMVRATAYLALGELSAAADAADQAVRAKPIPSTYLERALVRQAQGRDGEAEADFASAVRVEDYGDVLESARVRALWSRFLVRRGNYQGAKRVIDEALRIAPDNALALSIRAELELRTGKAKAARADLEQAFLAQHQVRYLIDEARALDVMGDRAGATVLRQQVEGIVRDDLKEGGFGHRLELVEVLVDQGTGVSEAVELAREELTRRPAAETRFQLARALAAAGEVDEAYEQIQSALATGAREPQYYELASRLERKRNDAEGARSYERLADSLDPTHGAWRTIGMPR